MSPPTAWPIRYTVVKQTSAISRLILNSSAASGAIDDPVFEMSVMKNSRKQMIAESYIFRTSDHCRGCVMLSGAHRTVPSKSTSKPFAPSTSDTLRGIAIWCLGVFVVLVGFSVVEFDNVLSGYLCDTYATYAASANAPMAFLRAVLSGVFPLFGRQLFQVIGSNNALFVLAGIATAYCGIAVLFGLYGKRIRERSPIAERTWIASLSAEKLAIVEVSVAASKICS